MFTPTPVLGGEDFTYDVLLSDGSPLPSFITFSVLAGPDPVVQIDVVSTDINDVATYTLRVFGGIWTNSITSFVDFTLDVVT